MNAVSVEVGIRGSEGKRDVTYRFDGKEYIDRLDTSSGYQREQSLHRAIDYFGLDKKHLTQLGMELARLANEKDQKAANENMIGLPFLKRLDTVRSEELVWLWPGKIAIGKLNILSGDPGLGKSLITLDFAARVTKGREWPDGTQSGDPGKVLLISFEDDVADTILPRLKAAEADLSRVDFMQGVMDYGSNGDEFLRPFDIRRDIQPHHNQEYDYDGSRPTPATFARPANRSAASSTPPPPGPAPATPAASCRGPLRQKRFF